MPDMRWFLISSILVLFSAVRGTNASGFKEVCGGTPTIIFPAGYANCLYETDFSRSFRVVNATQASVIRFTTSHAVGLNLSFQSYETETFLYSSTSESSSRDLHTITAKVKPLTSEVIEVPFTGHSTNGCAGSGRISVVSASIELPSGESMSMERIDGGVIFSYSDFGPAFASGDVFFSDGKTKVPNAIIEVLEINGIPYFATDSYRGIDMGEYLLGTFDDILNTSATILIRACVPDLCGYCSETEEILYKDPGWPGHPVGKPVHHDFILPIDPPISNPRSDINQDNKIDEQDLIILLQDWKKVTGG